MLDFSFHNDAATTKPLRFFNVVVFLTVVFHKFSSESVAFNVFPCERCHCWCWRQSERHSGIPSTPLLPSVCPRNSSVRRRCSDTDLEEKPHSCHIACCRVPICVSTFFFDILISVYAVFPPRRTGPWSGTTSSQKEDDGHGVRGGELGCTPPWLQGLLHGLSGQVATALPCGGV